MRATASARRQRLDSAAMAAAPLPGREQAHAVLEAPNGVVKAWGAQGRAVGAARLAQWVVRQLVPHVAAPSALLCLLHCHPVVAAALAVAPVATMQGKHCRQHA